MYVGVSGYAHLHMYAKRNYLKQIVQLKAITNVGISTETREMVEQKWQDGLGDAYYEC